MVRRSYVCFLAALAQGAVTKPPLFQTGRQAEARQDEGGAHGHRVEEAPPDLAPVRGGAPRGGPGRRPRAIRLRLRPGEGREARQGRRPEEDDDDARRARPAGRQQRGARGQRGRQADVRPVGGQRDAGGQWSVLSAAAADAHRPASAARGR